MNAGTTNPIDFRYLTSPPEGRGEVPSATRPQHLPLGSLSPKDFERLCYRLTRLDATVEQCRFYGVSGQAQQGIDLYARQIDGSYKVVQCKRSSDGFTPGEVTAAVDKFLDGEWADTASVFVLAVTVNLDRTQAGDRIEVERCRLAERGIGFLVWDETEISTLLKNQPRLVDDFFGRDAVRVYLGDEVANTLVDRLDVSEMIEYRDRLGRLYREVFQRLERGVQGDDRNVPLDDRFVVPDVLINGATSTAPTVLHANTHLSGSAATQFPSFPTSQHMPDVVSMLRSPAATPVTTGRSVIHHGDRLRVTDWLSTGSQHVVVGAPGSGKSALLRTLVLDVLAPVPSLIGQVERVQGVLPVWLPFAFWTSAARRRDTPVSVLDAVRDWLDAYDHGHLWPLVEKALRDERLLLVVDGLDEWASPDLARACIDRLEVFANTMGADVLASSRPFSTVELPIDINRWRISSLAPLDCRQRLDFIRKWLTSLIPEPSVEEATDWADEIDASPHLRELSDLPLFLLLLLRSREQQNEFPKDLHAVLSEAVTRLIGDHRRRKIDTSGVADQLPLLADIRKVSAATAEHMHLRSMQSIPDDELRDVFRRTLAKSIGYPDSDAHSMAVVLVNSLSPGVGLMVRPAPDETRFFHRSVLEFLAAERLLTRPSDEQIALFCGHLSDRRWFQVLRFLVRGLSRSSEISAIFEALDQAAASNPLLREAADLLAVDVAVGAGNADAQTRRRLMDRVVGEIEMGERDAHHAALLDRLTVGFSRREFRGELRERFGAWLRGSSPVTWSSVLRAASTWEPGDTLLGMLWHALLSENDEVQRVAGQVLSAKFAGQDVVADRLAGLVSTTRLYDRRAVATEALSLGWPDHSVLDALIESGRKHDDFAVRHASLAADLRRGNATEANRSLLIDLVDHAPSMSSWSDGLLDLMFEYYPDDDVIFEHYVQEAAPSDEQFGFDAVPAMFLIFRGYTHRPEARQYFLKLIHPERYTAFVQSPSLLTDHIPWKEIGKIYGSDAEVVTAVEALVRERLSSPIGEWDIYYCSLVARTDWVRDQLIQRIERRDSFRVGWAIKALVEGWPNDPNAREALAALIDPEVGPVPDSAIRHLTKIIADPDTAMNHLVTLAANTNNQDVVVHALNEIIKLGGSPDDPRAKTIIDRVIAYEMANFWSTGPPQRFEYTNSVNYALAKHTANVLFSFDIQALQRLTASPEYALYVGFSDDVRVREFALSRLDERDAPIAAIVYGFRNDPEIRQTIAGMFRPLSPPLRGRLVESLAQTSSTDTAATALLARYDAEPDPIVKLLAATAYARRLKATGNVTDEIVDTFTEQARAIGIGPDLDERRAAGFCALAELGRLDRLTDLREHLTPDEPVQIKHSLLSNQTVFYRYVCRYWDDIKAALGDDFQHRFGYRNSGDSEFWWHVLTVAHDYPATRKDIARKLDKDQGFLHSAATVGYLSRIEPGSDRLLDVTINLLKGTHASTYHYIQRSWTALHVLAEQFADHPRVHAWLDAELKHIGQTRAGHDGPTHLRLPSLGTLAAIARHRADHPLLRELVADAARCDGEPWRTFHEWVELTASTVTSAKHFVELAVEISHILLINDLIPDYLHQPLTARLRRDAPLAAAVAALVPDLSGPATGLAVRLLALSGRIDDHLADYLRARLTNTDQNQTTATIDPMTRQIRHIEMLFLDVLDTIDGP